MDKKCKKRRWREAISDLLLVSGGAAVSIGIGLIYPAAGLIACGVLAITYGWLIGRGGD